MVKNLTVGSIFGSLCQSLSPQFFFVDFISASYHHIQFQQKSMIQIQEKDKKSNFGPDLGPLDPNLGHQI